MSFTRKTPNAGHEALAALAREFPALRDKKGQGQEGVDNDREEQDGDDDGHDDDCCPYSFDKEIRPEDFTESVRATLTLDDDDAHTAAARGLGRSLTEMPRCPGCGEASSPMSLLFDEDYDSHSFYEFEKAEDWFKEADAVVFVGTSFAVTLTSLAIREAKRRGIPVFDFNVSVSLKSSPALDAKTVLGRAEATLPALASASGVSIATTPTATPSPAAAAAAVAMAESATGNSGSSIGGSSSGGFSERECPEVGPVAAPVPARGEDGGEFVDGRTSPAATTSGDDSGSPLGRRRRRAPEDASSGGGSGGGGGGGGSSGGDSSGGDVPQAEEEEEENDEQHRGAKRAKCVLHPASGIAVVDAAAVGEPVTPMARPSTAGDVDMAWGGGAEYLLEPALETPLRRDQVRVDVAEAYSRKPHPDPEEQLAKNPLLFNGSKFRLAGFSTEGDRKSSATATGTANAAGGAVSDTTDSCDGGGGGGRHTPPLPPLTNAARRRSRSPTSSSPRTRKLRLRLGLTDYRTFRGTNWSPSAARLAADSARDHPWLEAAYLSQKLGVGAVVETKDGFLLSLCRSNGVAEGQGMMGAPGGHPEPEKLGLTPEVLQSLSTKAVSSRRKVGLQAADELFDSAVQEVVDETNVPREALGEPLLSGLVRQGNSFGAPTAAFIIPCSLTRGEAAELYAKGAKEAFESTGLRTVPGSEIVAEGVRGWFSKRGLGATPSFQGALELWRGHRLMGEGGDNDDG
ncbi:unnamed protein product [Ectocarpus sp. 13 AM-2016]